MPIAHPPRREPRVLALTRVPRGVCFAVIDPWNVRSSGVCHIARRSEPSAIRRLIARERPTALTARDEALLPALRRAITGTGVGIVTGTLPTLPVAVARDLYPELGRFAPTRALQRAAVRAIAAILHGNIPTRLYASSRQRTVLRPAA